MSLDFSLTFEIDTGNEPESFRVFDSNMTHNVSPMWVLAGVWESLYDSNDKKAAEIMDNLRVGIEKMEANPEEYKKLNPENGWGDYYGALQFLHEIYKACTKYPKATIGVSR